MIREEDLYNKVNKLINSDVKQGEELAAISQGQQQLMEILATQRENLMGQANSEAAAEETRQLLAQASEIIASNSLGGGAAHAPVQQMNPQTQDLLKKFGVKPSSTTSVTRNTVKTPQDIIVNNNTENNITNVSNIAAPLAAAAAAPVVYKQSQEGGTAKLKAWLNNVFASQRESAVRREKEYRKKEWSLSRTTRQLMRGLDDMTKNLSKKLDPRVMSNTVGGQIRTLYTLIGLPLLIKNLGRFLEYIGATDDKPFLESKLVTDINRLFKGDEGTASRDGKRKGLFGFLGGIISSSFDKLVERISDKDSGFSKLIGSIGTTIVDSFKTIFGGFFSERAAALKALPQLKIEKGMGIEGIFGELGNYLKQILGCLVSGKNAIVSNTQSNIKRVGTASSMGSDEGSPIWAGDPAKMNHGGSNYSKNTDMGALSSFTYKGKTSQHHLSPEDVDRRTGELKNTPQATKRQSAAVGKMLSQSLSSDNKFVHTAGIVSGLGKLDKTVTKDNNILIDPKLFQGFRDLGINLEGLREAGGIEPKEYVFVKREKTEEDYRNRHDLGSFNEEFLKSVTSTAFTNAVSEAAGGGLGMRWFMSEFVEGDNSNHNFMARFPAIKAFDDASDKKREKKSKNDYFIDLIPVDQLKETDQQIIPSDGTLDGRSHKNGVFTFPTLTRSGMDYIKREFSKSMGGKSTSDYSFEKLSANQLESLVTTFENAKKGGIIDENVKQLTSDRDRHIERLINVKNNTTQKSLDHYKSILEKIENREGEYGKFSDKKLDKLKKIHSEKIEEYSAQLLEDENKITEAKSEWNTKIEDAKALWHDFDVGKSIDVLREMEKGEKKPVESNKGEGNEEEAPGRSIPADVNTNRPGMMYVSGGGTSESLISLADLTHSDTAIRLGISNVPGEKEAENLNKLRENVLDPLREYLASEGITMRINSGYRSPKVNEEVGGAKTSKHLEGNAVDVTTGSKKLDKEIARKLTESGLVGYTYQKDTAAGNSFFHITRKLDGTESYLDFKKIMAGDYSKSEKPKLENIDFSDVDSGMRYADAMSERDTEQADTEYVTSESGPDNLFSATGNITFETTPSPKRANFVMANPESISPTAPTNFYAENTTPTESEEIVSKTPTATIQDYTVSASSFVGNNKTESGGAAKLLSGGGDLTDYLRIIEYNTRLAKDATILGLEGSGLQTQAICEQTKVIQQKGGKGVFNRRT